MPEIEKWSDEVYKRKKQEVVDAGKLIAKTLEELQGIPDDQEDKFYGDVLAGVFNLPLVPDFLESKAFRWLVKKIRKLVRGLF